MAPTEPRWLLLIHQIPPTPGYLRVKIGRHLQRLGAVAIKNSVYALPASDPAVEDLDWVRREIVGGGGDAALVEARLVAGLSDAQMMESFRSARDADYDAIARDLRALAARLPKRKNASGELRAELSSQLARLRKRMADVEELDFFHARSRETAAGLLAALDQKLALPAGKRTPEASGAERPRGATWVTRTGIHVDRIASAWLIRRFIDPQARFKFVVGKEHRHTAGELRFDMFDGEFTHQGELCTFEVLLERFVPADAALRILAESIHDIDLKDARYERPETQGLSQMINAICTAHPDDLARLERGSALFDDLYELHKQRRR